MKVEIQKQAQNNFGLVLAYFARFGLVLAKLCGSWS